MKTWDPDDYDKYQGVPEPRVNWLDRSAWVLLLISLGCGLVSAWITR